MKNNPRSMYAILAFIFLITLGFTADWYYDQRIEVTNTCTLSAAYETFSIQGTKTHIRKITITWELPLTSVSKEPEEIVWTYVGQKFNLLETSDALDLQYQTKEKDDERTLILCLTVTCERLTANDYEYLNANDLSLLGTVDYANATCEDLAVVLSSRGYSCSNPK